MAVPFPFIFSQHIELLSLPASKESTLEQCKGRDWKIGGGDPGTIRGGLGSSPIWTPRVLGEPQQITHPLDLSSLICWVWVLDQVIEERFPLNFPTPLVALTLLFFPCDFGHVGPQLPVFVNLESRYLSWPSLWIDECIQKNGKYKCH